MNANFRALPILGSVHRSLKTANLSVARLRRDAVLAASLPKTIQTNTIKLVVAFSSTNFQVPISFPSARRGIRAARSVQQFFESPAAFKLSPALQGQFQWNRGQNNNNSNE